MTEEKEKKYNIVYQNDDIVVGFIVKEEEEEWVKVVLIQIAEKVNYMLLVGGVLDESNWANS